MAAKEKKAATNKQLSQNDKDKSNISISPDSQKLRRGRKVTNNGKVNTKPSRARRQETPNRSKKMPEATDEGTPPSTARRKPFLEKELEDILENATGRNTPSMARSRKGNDDDDVEKLGRTRKSLLDSIDFTELKLRRATDDDTVSVRSFTTSRNRRNADKDVSVDEEVAPAESIRGKGKLKSAVAKQIVRVKKQVIKKAIAVKTKPKLKVEKQNDNKDKRIIKKPLRFQNKMGAQRKLRSAMLKKKRTLKGLPKDVIKPAEERLNVMPEGGEEIKKRRFIKKEAIKKSEKMEVDKVSDVYAFCEADDGSRAKVAVKQASETRKRKRESGIHFETTRSPDDASVIIVQPRLGPKVTKKPATAASKVKKKKTTDSSPVSSPLPSPGSAPAPPPAPVFLQSVPSVVADCTAPPARDIIVTPSGIVLSNTRLVSVPVPVPVPAALCYPGPTSPSSHVSTSSSPVMMQRPEAMSTSLISTSSTTVVLSPVLNAPVTIPDLGLFTAATQTDTILSEKANEGEAQRDDVLAAKYRVPRRKDLPMIPVAKNVSDLLILKNKSAKENANMSETLKQGQGVCEEPETREEESQTLETMTEEQQTPPVAVEPMEASGSVLVPRAPPPTLPQLGNEEKKRCRNVRLRYSCGSEMTYSEPEIDEPLSEVKPVKKAVSCERLPMEYPLVLPSSPKNLASQVCSFSKESEIALKELGLDSDLDVSVKSEDEPKKEDAGISKIAKMKQEVDNVLKEMPIRKVPSLFHDDNRVEVKTPIMLKNEYPSKSPAKPPTVIDKLLEKNKSLKKAELESALKLQNSVRSLNFERDAAKVRRGLKEGRTKKFNKGLPHKPYTLERRGSNPEIYSTVGTQNENIPLRRVTDPGQLPRRGSVEMPRRVSLLDDREMKTEPRVINIVTGSDGSKKGQNLMQELQMELSMDARRRSVESNASDSSELPDRVPYKQDTPKVEKLRLSIDRKSLDERKPVIEETPEDLANKETILSALGLQSLKAAAQHAAKKKEMSAVSHPVMPVPGPHDTNGYTGTLKTVIKIQRQEKKGNSKNPLKMIYRASVPASVEEGPSPLVAPASYTPDDVESREDADDGCEDGKNGSGKAKALVIPEKASSFSIHPGRMCSDVCTYCFGKFGLLDTPCHIAQLKDADKRRNILATEVHLTADSCLCDACFRHVDKKLNCPTYNDTSKKTNGKKKWKQMCCAANCNAESQHNVRRKTFLKLKKSIGRKIVLEQYKLDHLQHSSFIPLCHRHIYWVDYFLSCGICKKRLNNVNMYRVSPEVLELNAALSADGIPTILTEKRFLCKLCHCYAAVRIKSRDPIDMSQSHRQFYETCRKRILQCHGIEVPDSEVEVDDADMSQKNGGKAKRRSKPTSTVTIENSKSSDVDGDVDVGTENGETFVPCMNIPPGKTNGSLDFNIAGEHNPTQIHVKLGNLNIGALGNLNIGQDARQCYPTDSDLALRAHFELHNEDESAKLPRKGFDKLTATIQVNPETKKLFYELQTPYGNHSSFFRHLLLLEKYHRNGDLVLSRTADQKAANYMSSVQNRLRSYEGVNSPSVSIHPQPVKPGQQPAQTKPADPKPPASTPSPAPPPAPSSASMASRPFTLTPMPPTPAPSFPKTSPLSQIQATVQSIAVNRQPQNIIGSLLKTSSSNSASTASGSLLKSSSTMVTTVVTPSMSSSSTTSVTSKPAPPKPEISITSVSTEQPSRVTKPTTILTTKIQENLRNLASKGSTQSTPASKPTQARAVILNRTIGGQKQSLVQVTTGGKTIHLTLSQFKRIQQMQIRKKQYLEHQAKLSSKKDDAKQQPEDVKKEGFPCISDVRSLAQEEDWSQDSASNPFPKIPKTLSVSVTKKSQPESSIETVE